MHLRHNLVEVRPSTREAVFQHLDTGEEVVESYDLLHVTPPMATPDCLAECGDLVDEGGFLSVDKETLQHTKYCILVPIFSLLLLDIPLLLLILLVYPILFKLLFVLLLLLTFSLHINKH